MPDGLVGDQGGEDEIETCGRDRVRRRGEGEKRIDALRDLGRTPPAMSQLAFDPARDWSGVRARGGRYPQAACGLSEPADCWCRGCRGQGIDPAPELRPRSRRWRPRRNRRRGCRARRRRSHARRLRPARPCAKSSHRNGPRRRSRKNERCLRDKCGRNRLSLSIRHRAPAPTRPHRRCPARSRRRATGSLPAGARRRARSMRHPRSAQRRRGPPGRAARSGRGTCRGMRRKRGSSHRRGGGRGAAAARSRSRSRGWRHGPRSGARP